MAVVVFAARMALPDLELMLRMSPACQNESCCSVNSHVANQSQGVKED